jgi:hypothetical protein
MKNYFYLYFFEIEVLLFVIQIVIFIFYLCLYNINYLITKYIRSSKNQEYIIIKKNNSFNIQEKDILKKYNLLPNPTKMNRPPRKKKFDNENLIYNNKDNLIKLINACNKNFYKNLFENLKNKKKSTIILSTNSTIKSTRINTTFNNFKNKKEFETNESNSLDNLIRGKNKIKSDNRLYYNHDNFFYEIDYVYTSKNLDCKVLLFYLKNMIIIFSVFIINDYNIYILKLSAFLFYLNSIFYINNIYNFFKDFTPCELDYYEFKAGKFFITTIFSLLIIFFLRHFIITQKSLYLVIKNKIGTKRIRFFYSKSILVYFVLIFIFLIINFIVSIERYDNCEGKLYYEIYDFLLQLLFGLFLNIITVIVIASIDINCFSNNKL